MSHQPPDDSVPPPVSADLLTVPPETAPPPAAPPAPEPPPPASPAPAPPGIGARIRRLLPGLAFVLGLAVIAWGLRILRGGQPVESLPPAVRDVLLDYNLPDRDAIIIGGALMLLGALGVGLAARRALPDRLAGTVLPWPQRWRDPWAGGALGLGLAAHALLWFHLATQQYTHADIALFGAGLLLVGGAIDRLDRPRRAATLGFTWRDGVAALALAGLALALNLVELTHWTFAWIGDEGSFFGAARDLWQLSYPWNFFNLAYVYNAHPLLDSVYQGAVMQVAGNTVWGWRFAEALVVAASTALLYPLGTILLGRVGAVAACIALASSHYLMAFARIAYNNLHMVFWGTLVLLLLALAWRTGRAVFVFATGAALGFCLYTFQIAVVTGPLLALVLLLIFFRRPSWGQVLAGLVLTAGLVLVVAPGLLATPLDLLVQNAINNSRREVAVTDPALVARISIVQSFLYFWDPQITGSHYVSGALVDAVTGLGLLAGLAVGLARLHKRAERLIVVWFLAGLVLLSISNYVPHPQLTRLLYLIPAAALLVGLAVSALDRLLRTSQRLPPLLAGGLALLGLLAVPPLNLYQLLVLSPAQVGANDEIMRMKAVQEHPDRPVVEVGVKPLNESEVQNALLMFGMYPWLAGHYQYVALADFQPPNPPSVTGTLPIYLVVRTNPTAMAHLVDTLPPPYHLAPDYDPAGSDKVWLFAPAPGGPALRPPGAPPPLRTPAPLVEVHLPGPADPQSPAPGDVAVDSTGSFYVAGLGDSRIHKFDPQGHEQGAWGLPSGNPADPVIWAGLAAGPDDTIYTLDATRGHVRRFDGQGRERGPLFGGLASGALGLAVAADGDVLVADTANGRLVRYSPHGQAQPGIGQPGAGPGQFAGPTDVAGTGRGDYLALDAGNARIQHLGPDGSPQGAWPAPAAGGARLALDRFDRLYVTAPATREVRVYDLTGAALGSWTLPDAPGGIFVDAHDQLYLTFPATGIVRKYRLGP